MKSQDLSEFFNLLGEAKKEKKEEFDKLLKEANIDLDSLVSSAFDGIEKAKTEQKEQKEKEEKFVEQLDDVVVELNDPLDLKQVVNYKQEIKDELLVPKSVTVGVPEDFDISSLEIEEEKVDDVASTYKELKKEIGSKKKPEEPAIEKIKEDDDTITKALKFIESQGVKEELQNIGPNDPEVDSVKKQITELRGILYKVLAHGPGSGETRIEFLDDVDRDSAKVNGKVLQYDSTTEKWVGGTSSGIGTEDSISTSGIITAGQFYGNGSGLTGVASTDNIRTNTNATFLQNINVSGTSTVGGNVLVGSGITLSPDGNVYATGIITATTFKGNFEGGTFTGDGSNLTGVASTDNIRTNTNATFLQNVNIVGTSTVTGGVIGDVTGDLTGNADTATALETARTIGGVSFDGTANINLPGVNQSGNQNTSGTAANLSGNPSISVTNITASGNVTVGGTLTYEDVTNVDSVGLITARSGIKVGSGITLSPDGDIYAIGVTTVTGNLVVGGDLDVTGDISYDEVSGRNLNISGVSTFNQVKVGSGITLSPDGDSYYTGVTTITNSGVGTVHVGYGNTALIVDGDLRVLGILTVGGSSVTIDGDNNQLSVGIVTVTNSTIILGDNVSLDASATGINSAPNVLYVAKDGLDTNNGTSIDNAFLTISAAVGAASSGTTVKVLSGKYTESNPISVPAFVSIVGDDQRTVEVKPNTTNKDIFHVRKGVKLANMTFKDHVAPAAAVAFPTDEIAENVGGGKWKGPYIQNCTSDTTTGKGVYIDGDQARLLKAMNVDAFTQYNQGGVGVAVTNGGFAQLVSLFTICCNEAVTVHKGGQADIANSNCSFGTYGLVAKGVSDLQYTGIVTATAAISQAEVKVNVDTSSHNISGFNYTHQTGVATVTTATAHGFKVGMGVTLANIAVSCAYGNKTYPHRKPYIFEVESVPSTTTFSVNVGISTVAHTYQSGGTAKIDVDRPYDGQLVYFDKLYKQVKSITVTNGGSGYTSTPTVTIDAPTGPSGETASAYATLEGTTIKSITLISSGNQYLTTPDVTISGGGGSNGAATASMDPLYYTINSSTPVSSGISTITLATNLLNEVGIGSTVFFSQGSRIVASSHTFEYVGAGDQIVTATPKRGGVTIQANEVITEDGGKVLYTSTDQAGNFRIGDDLKINQETGTISGRAFSKSLFSEMTPFILALS